MLSKMPGYVLVAAVLVLALPVTNLIARGFGVQDPWLTTITAAGQVLCAAIVGWWASGIVRKTLDQEEDER